MRLQRPAVTLVTGARNPTHRDTAAMEGAPDLVGLEALPVEEVGEGTLLDGGRLGGMADGDDADEGEVRGRAKGFSDGGCVGLR